MFSLASVLGESAVRILLSIRLSLTNSDFSFVKDLVLVGSLKENLLFGLGQLFFDVTKLVGLIFI